MENGYKTVSFLNKCRALSGSAAQVNKGYVSHCIFQKPRQRRESLGSRIVFQIKHQEFQKRNSCVVFGVF